MDKIEEMLSNNQELTGAYKDFYEHYLRLLTQVREQRFPKLLKPVWYVE